MALGGIDLNLLVILQALIEEGSVTRAGMRVGMPQPAMSTALARLRRHYKDELLVRTANGYELTPLARSLLDIQLPSSAVFADIQRLSENLIEMNEILRDRTRSTVRLVMNPDKMVIGEAMRTFTYLNLYGYLTDAVIVNRVFPADVGDYFAAWRRVQEEHLELVRSAYAPVPAPTSKRSWKASARRCGR